MENKKILIVPMSAIAETSGPVTRCIRLTHIFKEAGCEVATCMAEDINFRPIAGVTNYFLDIPMPLGLPGFIATRTFPLAQKLGITSRKEVRSFDEVLRITGNLDYRYLNKSVEGIRTAMKDFKPDIVYSEFNISAIIAAKAEGVTLYTTVSFPTRYDYAHNDKLAGGLNRLLSELRLPEAASALKLFEWADKRYCMSIKELEPFGEDVEFCGAMRRVDRRECRRNKILVYMGNGTVPAKKMRSEVIRAFEGSPYEVYIASSYLKEETRGNIHIAPRWDFNEYLEEAVLFINHGGQNSIVDGLLHGVPQLIVPGKVFERRFNAGSVVKNNAGIMLPHKEWNAVKIRQKAELLIGSDEMRKNAEELGTKLMSAGGPHID